MNPHAASGGTDSSATPWQPLGECFDKAPFCSSGESAANCSRNTFAVSKSSGYARKSTWLGKKRNQVNSRICDRGVTLIRRSQAERAEIVTAGHHPFTHSQGARPSNWKWSTNDSQAKSKIMNPMCFIVKATTRRCTGLLNSLPKRKASSSKQWSAESLQECTYIFTATTHSSDAKSARIVRLDQHYKR